MAVWVVWTGSGIYTSWILSGDVAVQWECVDWSMGACTSVTVWVVRASSWIHSGWVSRMDRTLAFSVGVLNE